jgi:hypothetical protein
MPDQSPKVSSIPASLAAVALVLMLPPFVAAQQHSQSIYLPDPTPRPPDLQRQYGDDPAQRAREEQAAKLRKALMMQQVVTETNALSVLAQELKDEMGKREKGTSFTPAFLKVEEIEKRAKKLKENMKSR